MYLFNPLQPGSVYTDILADGAVTLIKTDFATNPLPVSAGGTGSPNPSPAATAPLTLSGTWPNQTIALTTPLAVADGGTGTTTPAVTAGANITVIGTWPDVTVALDSAVTLGGDYLILGSGTVHSGIVSFPTNGDVQLRMNEDGSNNQTDTTKSSWAVRLDPTTDTFSIYRAPPGNPPQYAEVFACGSTGNITVYGGLAIGGAVTSLDGETLTGPGVPGIVQSFSGTAQATGTPISFTTTSTGFYRVSAWVYRTSNGTSATVSVNTNYASGVENTVALAAYVIAPVTLNASEATDGSVVIYNAANETIQVFITDSDTTNYSAHFRIVVEYLGA